eukprot:10359059-Alexandrium_andersonii.AAC.1
MALGPLPAEPPPLWLAIMGPAGPALWHIVARPGSGLLDSCRAILFADQSRAFERVGLRWLRRVGACPIGLRTACGP